MVYLRKGNGQFHPERVLYNRSSGDQPCHLSMRDPSESQWVCPSFKKNRPCCQPCDHWRSWILCVPLRMRTQWYPKRGSYYQLPLESFCRSESAENIYIHKCRNIHTGNPWHIYRTVANWIIISVRAKTKSRWTNIRSAHGRESSGTGWSYHWFITCAVCIPGNTIPSRKDTGIFKIKSKQSESIICTSS